MRGTTTDVLNSMQSYKVSLNGKLKSNGGISCIVLNNDYIGQIQLVDDMFCFIPFGTIPSGTWIGGSCALIDY